MKYHLLIILLLFSYNLLCQQKGATPIPNTLITNTQSQTYAVVVGISDYQDEEITDLRFADKDALAIAGFLQSPAGGSLDKDNIKVLINEKATVAQFAIALDWLLEVANENDRVIIYFSGHGDVERKTITQPGYLLCWDAPSKIYMAGGALALPMFQEVISTLSLINKSQVIVITDACRSGKLSGSQINGNQLTNNHLKERFANEIKILSCQPDEYSIEGEQWGGGRGAFSYHLLDGLSGMADINQDQSVSLLEISRYLEDHVTTEVAPQSQIPITTGKREEILTDVFPEILAQLEEGKRGQMQLFSPTVSRGIESDVLTSVDSDIVKIYTSFQNALKDKRFLIAEKGQPENDYADFYYEKLMGEPGIERLHSTIRRNYAAALQDDAQQVMNDWIKTSLDQKLEGNSGEVKKTLPKKVFTEKVKTFPKLLDRASELLGEKHYMYATLKARKFFFEGYLLTNSDRNPNKELGEKALSAFNLALYWQPELPQAYWQMALVYGYNLLQPDSAEVYVQKAISLYPYWIVPYADIAFMFSTKYRSNERAKPYLEKALKIDSSSYYALNGFGVFYDNQKDYEKAEMYYRKAIQVDSTIAYAYNNLGIIYATTERFEEAEKYYRKAIQVDSTVADSYNNLGFEFMSTGRFEEAEKYFLKAIQVDSFKTEPHVLLGSICVYDKRYEEAKFYLKKAILLDSLSPYPYNNLGAINMIFGNYEEAENYFRKAIQFDSTFWTAYTNLSLIYQSQQRWQPSESMIVKAIEYGPPLGLLSALLGNAFTHLPNRLEDAKNELDKALEMDADYPDTYIYLTQWSLKKNLPEKAWQYLEQGLEKGFGNGELKLKDIQEGPDFVEMRKEARWEELMKKYFPEEHKD